MTNQDTRDPIVEEVRQAGREYMQRFNGDMKAAMDDLRRLTRESGKPVVSHPPMHVPPQPRTAAKAIGGN
jgi:hypothetical protein